MNYEIGHQIPACEIAAHREYVVKQSGRPAPDFFETLRAVRRRTRGKLIRAEPKTAIDLTEARFSVRFRGIYDALDFAALADAISLGGVEVRKTRKAQRTGDLVWRAEFTASVGVARYLDGVSDLRETRAHFAAIRVRRELQERDAAPEPEPEPASEPAPSAKLGRPRRAGGVGSKIVSIRFTERELAALDRRVEASEHASRGELVRALLELDGEEVSR